MTKHQTSTKYRLSPKTTLTWGICLVSLAVVCHVIFWLIGMPTGRLFETVTGAVNILGVAGIVLLGLSRLGQTPPPPAQTTTETSGEASERSRALTLINNITDAVFSTDQKGIVKAYNSAALNLLDTNRSIDGAHISELMSLETEEGGSIDPFEELSKSNSIRKRDDIILPIDANDRLRLEATFAPVQAGDSPSSTPDSYVLILRDITIIKSLEEERDEFISVVSHELRTPVAVAEGSLSNALVFGEQRDHDKAIQAVSEAHRQVMFLARLVNDLSTLSRAERGLSDEAETINTRDLAHQLHKEYTPQAEAKKLQLNLDIIGQPRPVHTSRLYLQELLQSFLTNAIKYTTSGSITLSIKDAADGVEFRVTDTGIGIGKADLENIFKRFYRAEDYRTRETNGTGLGLYVASKLARKLGCSIGVESRLNHGSTFYFTLPPHTPTKED